MKCPRCSGQNQQDARFCEDCGARFEVPCPSCGWPVSPGKKFCRSCGTAITAQPAEISPSSYTPKHLAERIINSKAALEGERKQVTVLFADLKGSMELLADRDPEEARKILDPVLERMMAAVHHYEGTVNQVMGDGIMALFGAPVAHEDHAIRACYAALRMQDSIRRYSEGLRRVEGVPIRIRVGLNSGEVVVRSIGSDLHMDYTAVGQTTHLAARMEQIAAPDTIVVAPATVALAEGFVQARSLGPTPIKGLADPIDVYELTAASTVRSRLQAAAAKGLTKFVGRSTELVHMHGALELTRSGRGQVIGVVGDAGVGKSRLFWEFMHSHRTTGCVVVEAPSVSYGKATPYYPVIELLKSYFAIDERDGARMIREKVTGKLLSLDRALEGSLPALLSLIDSGVDDDEWKQLEPSQRHRRTLDAVKRLFLRESQLQPVILVFEDLHWIDDETQVMLEALVESLPTARILLLVNYRPEYQHRWGSKTYYQQIRIDPLPAAGATALLESLLGPDPALTPLKQLLVARTDGNPFFLEETVRTLIEMDALAGERGAYRLSGSIAALTVPATAQAVLAARIDRLAPEDKRRLQAAAVIGKDVPLSELQTVADEPEEDLRAGISRLQAGEFLYEARLFPDIEYTFKHALTHEVAYGTLLHERRRMLHARVVEAIEHLHADRREEHVERIADHAFRGELWDKSLVAFRDAAIKASARSAPRTAITYFDQALDALRRLPRTDDLAATEIDLLLGVHGCAMPLGDVTRLHDAVAKAAETASAIGDTTRLGRATGVAAQNWWYIGLPERAIETAKQAVLLAEKASDELGLPAADLYLGQAYHLYGDFTHAVEALGRTTERGRIEFSGARLHPMRWRSINALLWVAWSLAELGQFPAAASVATEAVALSERHNTRFGLWHAYTGLVFTQLLKGEIQSARVTLARALAVAEECDLPLMINVTRTLLGYTDVLSGNVEKSNTRLERALTGLESIGFMAFVPITLMYRSLALLATGELDRALAVAKRTAEITREYRQHGNHAWALWALGEVTTECARLDVDAAEARYREAMSLANHLGMRPLVAHCHLGLAKLYRPTDRGEQRRQHLATATTMYREMGMTYWLERADRE